MVLNLLRVEDINPEWLLSKSFYQFQHCNKVPKMITALKDLENEKVRRLFRFCKKSFGIEDDFKCRLGYPLRNNVLGKRYSRQ